MENLITTVPTRGGPALVKALVAMLILSVALNSNAQSVVHRKDIPAIARVASRAVVSIVVADSNGRAISQGSGFVVSKNGRIVTNYHVIKQGVSAVIKFSTGAFFMVDGLVAYNKDLDLAVLKADGKDFSTLALGDSDRLQVGEEVIAIGNPFSLEATVSNGIISGIRDIEEDSHKLLQTTAPISPGSSGGPLFNMQGEVVAVTTAFLKNGQNLNFAIPINEVKPLLATGASKLLELPNEPTEQAVPRQREEGPVDAGVPIGTWKNLKDNQNYRTRIVNQRLYVEAVSPSESEIQTCEFERATSMGISWIGTCWERDRTSHLSQGFTAYLSQVSQQRIEGNKFILIRVE